MVLLFSLFWGTFFFLFEFFFSSLATIWTSFWIGARVLSGSRSRLHHSGTPLLNGPIAYTNQQPLPTPVGRQQGNRARGNAKKIHCNITKKNTIKEWKYEHVKARERKCTGVCILRVRRMNRQRKLPCQTVFEWCCVCCYSVLGGVWNRVWFIYFFLFDFCYCPLLNCVSENPAGNDPI